MTIPHDISEELVIDLTNNSVTTTYSPSDIAYDIAVAGIPFVIDATSETPYQRQTAQYKKDQFDNSTEPGEQSLTGWWIRSQTSFHNGAGLKFYEPGTDAAHATHKFYDSRGIDVWTYGQASLLPDLFHSYEGAENIVATSYHNGSNNVIIMGDSDGALKEITFNGNSTATEYSYTSLYSGHTSSNPFLSIDTDGSRYFAVCNKAIHRGTKGGTDEVLYNLGTAGISNAIIKYVKGYLLFGTGQYLGQLKANHTPLPSNHSGTSDLPNGSSDNFINHLSTSWNWTSITGGGSVIYAAGKNNTKSEIWAIPYDETKLNINIPAAYVVAEMPFGEVINNIYFYLGYLVIATNKGIRIATTNQSGYQAGNIIYGPLLVETQYEAHDIVANDKFVWVSTSVDNENGLQNACVIRIDLGTAFEDGTFAYAYDLEYQSDETSECKSVFYIDGRLHLIVNENGTTKGEIQSEHTTNKRTSGWLQTGYIRYSTVQPKYFKYIELNGNVSDQDTILVQTVSTSGTVYNIVEVDSISENQMVGITYPVGKQEALAFKFTLRNASPLSDVPTLESYQIKSLPAMPRQRLIQYPVMCYDIEMDKYNNQFGYKGNAYTKLSKLETIENNGDSVIIEDYRTGEQYTAIIEEISFKNKSSADKASYGFGGVITITVRKI